MTANAARAAFGIEIRERYGDVAGKRWPVSAAPLPDELLSSWLHRLALANGIAPRSFAGVLGLSERMWSPRLDLRLRATSPRFSVIRPAGRPRRSRR
ncbi:TniQ family protein [Mesorhizobium sp. YC-39]|uniref:TniQ family protein n=1 Tax=unclassified Mesorhizobium TaxID=325217 RepID=UPI0021E81E16|nr:MULTISPECIES: TniQ family protein [unclassified Mesorhizobium]MCV3211661.1 TniQ family protein [Mesorhizobium sp. YC-2]MCV3233435.1 TniQ family protein [Mesorhizobium sp. YC-39]